MHRLLDLRGSIPVFVDITKGGIHDVNVLNSLPIETGAYYVMDKGYTDFKRLYEKIHKQQAFFVTRSKGNINYEIIEPREVDTNCGVLEYIYIRLTGF